MLRKKKQPRPKGMPSRKPTGVPKNKVVNVPKPKKQKKI